MKARDAINHDTPALRTSDTVEDALGALMEHHLHHLPVVDEDGDLGRPHSGGHGGAGDDVVERPDEQLVATQPGVFVELGEGVRLVVECTPQPVALLWCEAGVEHVHAGVVVDLHRQRGGGRLPGGALETVVVGDGVDDRVELAAERVGSVRGGDLCQFLVALEEFGSVLVAEAGGGTGECIGVLGSDLAAAECVVQ